MSFENSIIIMQTIKKRHPFCCLFAHFCLMQVLVIINKAQKKERATTIVNCTYP